MRIAFLTTDNLDEFVTYDHLAARELARRGIVVEMVPWTAAVDWNRYRQVIIRSPWDYQDHAAQFMSVLEAINASTATLLNPLDVVRWNIHKRYLGQLNDAGVATVPTRFVDRLDDETLGTEFRRWPRGLVVKPQIGANADHTYRVNTQEQAADVLTTFPAIPAMVQPFLETIVEGGENSLFYFAGAYSHAINKRPASGDFRVQEEHGGIISAIRATRAMRDVASSALALVPSPCLYARVDLVEFADQWVVIELELIEPSLYFSFDENSPARFADAVIRWADEVSVDGFSG